MGGVFSERQIEQLSELTSRGWGIYDRTVKITEEMQVDVLSLRAEGMPSSEIAKKVGLSVRSVQRIARATAYHEAGHAAVGALFGKHPDWATLKPDPETYILGEVTQVDDDLGSKDGLEDEIINCYAGQCAELRAGGSSRRAKLGAEIDDRVARDCILHLHGENLTEKKLLSIEAKMRAAADKFLNEHWPLVERIAAELLDRTTLVLEELDHLRAIYQGEKSEEDLVKLREALAELNEQCNLVGKKAVYKGPTKEFGSKIISTWSCE